eukprot:1945755-Amphidinium_carterae.1
MPLKAHDILVLVLLAFMHEPSRPWRQGSSFRDRGAGETPFSSIDGSSPDVAARAGRVHVGAAPNGGG